jgi:hypothetical protein
MYIKIYIALKQAATPEYKQYALLNMSVDMFLELTEIRQCPQKYLIENQ